ncbi:unnamed protein product [Calypogeia fissa]
MTQTETQIKRWKNPTWVQYVVENLHSEHSLEPARWKKEKSSLCRLKPDIELSSGDGATLHLNSRISSTFKERATKLTENSKDRNSVKIQEPVTYA